MPKTKSTPENIFEVTLTSGVTKLIRAEEHHRDPLFHTFIGKDGSEVARTLVKATAAIIEIDSLGPSPA
jgi:hypothetical protein